MRQREEVVYLRPRVSREEGRVKSLRKRDIRILKGEEDSEGKLETSLSRFHQGVPEQDRWGETPRQPAMEEGG